MTTDRPTRVKLVIRCTGQRFNHCKNKPVGRVCGSVFESVSRYRSRAGWIELARTAGWLVSPLRPDNTVIACCPPCVKGKPRQRTRKDPS